DETIWQRAIGIPMGGFAPADHRFMTVSGVLVMLRQPPAGPRTLAELEARDEAAAERRRAEAAARAQEVAGRRRTAPVVTARILDRHAPLTLRDAAEVVHAAGGRITVEKGEVVVRVHPAQLQPPGFVGGASTVAVAVRALYAAHEQVLRAAKGK